MKSLVEEASTVAKAIEKAWNRAGNPQTFSVKVFENPETNFFGFTKKSAKVGIFFEEEAPQPVKKYTNNNRDSRSQNTQRQPQKGRDQAQAQTQGRDSGVEQPARAQQPRQSRPQNNRPARQSQPVNHIQQQTSSPAEQAPSHARDEQPRSARPVHEQRQNRSNERSNDRQRNNDRQTAPQYEQPRQSRDEYNYDSFKEEQPSYTQSTTSEHTTNSFERSSEREGRNSYDTNARSERPDRNNRNGRRHSQGNDRNDRNGARPQRAQRHEFNEEREMVTFTQEHTSSTTQDHTPTVPTMSANDSAAPIPSLIPQKKVLKVSGRRYSAPVKPTNNNDKE